MSILSETHRFGNKLAHSQKCGTLQMTIGNDLSKMEKEDTLGRYKAISNKLKKRFLKKPNVAEVSEEFAALARSMQAQEASQYSGFCFLAQARCEHTLGNTTGEAKALTDAAREFLKAERSVEELKCPSFREHLGAAINCYSHAIRVNVENNHSAIAAGLCIELADALKQLNSPHEALQHYQKAAELQFQNTLDYLSALGRVASCKIDLKDYSGALTVFTEMSVFAHERGSYSGGKPLGVFCDIQARCEISRVLLLMLLKPTPQRIRPEHAKTLEKYAWESSDDDPVVACMSEDLFLLLQSVVLACQSDDLESLQALQVDLGPLLSGEQNHLLHLVIQEIKHPAGSGT